MLCLNPFFWQPNPSCSQKHAQTRIESPWSSWEFSDLSLPLKWVGRACYRPNWTNLISFLPAVNLCQKLLLWTAILAPSRPIWSRQEATTRKTTFRKTYYTEIHIKSHTHTLLFYKLLLSCKTLLTRWDEFTIKYTATKPVCKLYILCRTPQGTNMILFWLVVWLNLVC